MNSPAASARHYPGVLSGEASARLIKRQTDFWYDQKDEGYLGRENGAIEPEEIAADRTDSWPDDAPAR